MANNNKTVGLAQIQSCAFKPSIYCASASPVLMQSGLDHNKFLR